MAGERGLRRHVELFLQRYHEPYYARYSKRNFGAMRRIAGLKHIRHIKRVRLQGNEFFDKAIQRERARRGRSIVAVFFATLASLNRAGGFALAFDHSSSRSARKIKHLIDEIDGHPSSPLQFASHVGEGVTLENRTENDLLGEEIASQHLGGATEATSVDAGPTRQPTVSDCFS